jgi:YgiT-type zinc finger domain-containing protein
MNYNCPNCTFGNLKPSKITYARRVGNRVVTMPGFSAWRCDFCGYTRYDVAALAKVELLLGPDEDTWEEPFRRRPQQTEGPGERGPHRWSS